MRIFATGRSPKSLAGLEGTGIETLTLDVTSSESVAALKAEIVACTGGRLDMLFNNAGMCKHSTYAFLLDHLLTMSVYEGPAIESDAKRVRQMFDANVFGVFDMVSAFTPLLLAAVSDSSRPPMIINTVSVIAVVAYPFAAQYNASKAAIASYSNTLRVELAPTGIMGVVSTGISSPDRITFDKNSIYASIEAGVKKRSQDQKVNRMKPDQFAK